MGAVICLGLQLGKGKELSGWAYSSGRSPGEGRLCRTIRVIFGLIGVIVKGGGERWGYGVEIGGVEVGSKW